MSIERLFSLWLCLFALPAWAGLEIQHWTTPQGARVYFVESRGLPILDVAVDFPAGSARDTPEKSGLASLTRHMMALGAGPYSERDIAERLADVGAQLSGRLDQERAGFILRTLSSPREREQAIAVLAAILQRPRFPEAVLQRERARAIASLKEARIKPEFVGEEAFQAALYGSHPYALPEAGREAAIARLARADLIDFHRRHYRARGMSIAILGDIGREEAAHLAERLAAGLPPGEAPPAIPPVAVPAAGKTQVIPHHATQSHIFMGLPGLKRDDPDYFPLLVGNYVLGGGGFDSRLMQEIRQRRGLAYSVYSYFQPLSELGPLQIGLQTKREATDEALRVVRETVRRFVAEGPTPMELKQAQDNLVGGFPLRLDSNKKILEHLAVIGFYRLPLDWLDTYPAKVEAVTPEAVRRAFQARIQPEAMQTVIVGGQTP